MEKSRASMLVGDGASRFAREEGFEATPSFDLATDENISKWKSFAANTKLMDLEFE